MKLQIKFISLLAFCLPFALQAASSYLKENPYAEKNSSYNQHTPQYPYSSFNNPYNASSYQNQHDTYGYTHYQQKFYKGSCYNKPANSICNLNQTQHP